MPNLGVTELVIILVIVVIIFGVGRMPEIGGAIGRSIKEFRDASQGTKSPEATPDREETSEKTS